MNQLNEETMTFLENRIPELAEGAIKQAYCKTLISGQTVIEAIDGQLIEFFADGSQKLIKSLPTATPTTIGLRKRRSI